MASLDEYGYITLDEDTETYLNKRGSSSGQNGNSGVSLLLAIVLSIIIAIFT